MSKTIAEFTHEIGSAGYAVFVGIVPASMLAELRMDIPRRVERCGEWQRRNGVGDGMAGAAHHVVGGDDSLNDFLCSMFLDAYIRAYFGGEYILNSYGALNNLPYSADTYKHGQRFHRDVRTYSKDFRLMLNMLVMVDDFTVGNGATKLVPGSHLVEERPDDAQLESRSVRLVGNAGDVVLFDSNLWHSAAPNTTPGPRMALTLTFTRPFFKQQMDYPRLLGEDFPRSEKVRQLLGYNARVPANYDEWYQPPEKRMYKPGQG
jgi:hypothetical protein